MTQQPVAGSMIGRFQILSELGRGGMAVVYRALQPDLDRVVALKVLPAHLTDDPSYVARFRQEARSAAKLEHPHIMPIYEVGETDGFHYIAMKFIAGRTLKQIVQQEGALDPVRAARYLAQVADALDYAHRRGVIHRDIKPSNVMLTEEDWVFLTDFGLARGTGNVESEYLNGEIERLGRQAGIDTPVNSGLLAIMREAMADGVAAGGYGEQRLLHRLGIAAS